MTCAELPVRTRSVRIYFPARAGTTVPVLLHNSPYCLEHQNDRETKNLPDRAAAVRRRRSALRRAVPHGAGLRRAGAGGFDAGAHALWFGRRAGGRFGGDFRRGSSGEEVDPFLRSIRKAGRRRPPILPPERDEGDGEVLGARLEPEWSLAEDMTVRRPDAGGRRAVAADLQRQAPFALPYLSALTGDHGVHGR